MLIRGATGADLGAVGALWNRMIRDTTATFTTVEKSDADLQALLAARGDAFLVAETDGICTGFMTWGTFRIGPGYAATAEHTIVTSGHAHGTGRALMQAGLAQARAQGLHVMIAGISAENAPGLAFHARMGFEKSGHLPQVGRKNGRWIDLILMSRMLNTP